VVLIVNQMSNLDIEVTIKIIIIVLLFLQVYYVSYLIYYRLFDIFA
jgi:hypothetical protein